MSQFSLRLVRHAAVLSHSHFLFFPTVSHALRTPPSLSYPTPTLATHYPHPLSTLLLLPSPLSPDHPPLVSIRGHGEQLPSIPVAGTSQIDSCYLFGLHPGYEYSVSSHSPTLFRLLPGFENIGMLVPAFCRYCHFKPLTLILESGQGGSDMAPLSMCDAFFAILPR